MAAPVSLIETVPVSVASKHPGHVATIAADKIDALRAKIAQVEKRALPQNPLSGVSVASWFLLDGLLACSLIVYGLCEGRSGGLREHIGFDAGAKISKYWAEIGNSLIPFIIVIWAASVYAALMNFRRNLYFWLIHSALKFPVAVALIIAGAVPSYLLSQAPENFFLSLIWISVVGGIIVYTFSGIHAAYSNCVSGIREIIDKEIAELNRQIEELTPKPSAPVTAGPKPAVYDDIID